MRSRWSGGTSPRKTSVSVPRLIPLCRARTRTSPGPGPRSGTSRISPAPGRATTKARAVLVAMEPPSRPRPGAREPKRSGPRTSVINPQHGGHMARVQLGPVGRLAQRPADVVTTVRLGLACVVAGLVVHSLVAPARTGLIVTLAAVALVLDAVDGQVARRTGTCSRFGARYDMEVDAFLVLALSVRVATTVAWWVLVIGLARYLLLVAGWHWPWLRGETPPR